MSRIAIGTTSIHKVDALREACARVGVFVDELVKCKTESGVNEQPVDFEETYTGAKNRAEKARIAQPDCDLWIGIESGIFRGKNVTIDVAVIVILSADGSENVTTSEGILFPEAFVIEAEALGFATTTVGSIITKHLGGDKTDPHSTLTNGRRTRKEMLTNGIATALIAMQ